MLLMCSTNKDIFYIALLMEQEPKRAFIHQHIKIKNKLEKVRKMNPQETVIIRENAEIKPQELAILSDTEEIKIMSTQPEQMKNGRVIILQYIKIKVLNTII